MARRILTRAQPDTAAPQAAARYKTAKYSFERPLQIGAMQAATEPELLECCRDELLGVFGDSEIKGKPIGDDLQSGKRTALVATAMARAGLAQRRTLNDMTGSSASVPGLARMRRLLTDTRAVGEVGGTIGVWRARALAAALEADISPAIDWALFEINHGSTTRGAWPKGESSRPNPGTEISLLPLRFRVASPTSIWKHTCPSAT